MEATEDLAGSFRDPAGTLRLAADRAVRYVRPGAAADARALLESSFYRQAAERGEMVATHRAAPAQDAEPGSLTLEHPLIFFPSYSWEWSPAQWLAAGELTLRLCEAALGEGWLLKDATPLNILFEGSRPVLVDVLSPERHAARSPLWTAKAQFVRTFLLPLAAYRVLGWPLAGSMVQRDGLTPAELAPRLPVRCMFEGTLFWNVILPAWVDRRGTASEERIEAVKSRESDPEVAAALIRRTLNSLRSGLRRMVPAAAPSQWTRYVDTRAHYSGDDQQAKQRFVGECLAVAHSAHVLDIGSNTGQFSMLAAKEGARVVALDTDIASVDTLYRAAAAAGADIQPLLVNIARPTPAAGWQNAEHRSFLDRARGRFDMVLMLAVIHHLLLTEQIPLEHIAALAAQLTTRWLVLEWVPPADPMFRQLLRGRGELYGSLSEEHLLHAFSTRFVTMRRQALANGRILFLFEKTA